MMIFWLGQIVIGSLMPLIFLASMGERASDRKVLAFASLLFLIGGLAQMYAIIIGGQAYPLRLFPGFDASSAFFNGAVNHYSPSVPEIILGLSGVSIAMLISALAFRLMPFLPQATARTGD